MPTVIDKKLIALGLLSRGQSVKSVAKLLQVNYGWVNNCLNSNYVIKGNFGVEIETHYDGEICLPWDYTCFYGLEYGEREPYDFDIHDQTHWRQVSDSSINCCGEYVSPILQGEKGLTYLKRFLRCLNEEEPEVSTKCGLHVHIDRDYFKDKLHVERFCNYYAKYEKQLDSIIHFSRRENNNKYCYSMTNCNRYGRDLKVNLQNKQTVEIRHHHGTTDYDVISNWIKILFTMVDITRIPIQRKDFKSILKREQLRYFVNNSDL